MGNQQERSLSWLAGILDGEGSISVQVYTMPDGRVRLTPYVCVVNSDPDILAESKRIFDELTSDAKTGKSRITGKTGTNKPCSTLRVDGGPCCRAIINAVYPYLISAKKRNADVVLWYIASRERRLLENRNALGHVIRSPYSKEEIEMISSIRVHKLAKSSEAICRAPNVIG